MHIEPKDEHLLHSSSFKRTKIIATLGPATNSFDEIHNLIRYGANGLRLNFSHGDYDEHRQRIEWVRKASIDYKKPVAIIQDLQGPKIRLGSFEGVIHVSKNESIRLKYKADYQRSGIIPTQYDLSKKVKRGHRLLIYDGKIRSTVTSVIDGIVHVRIENEGILLQKKGINLPDTDFAGDTITEKDRKDIAFGSTNGIDYVAQSFVQTENDIIKLRRVLKNIGSNAKIIAKIETAAALVNVEEIIKESDAVMVARGDLAVETSAEVVPIAQRKIVGLCRKYAKPVIIATQMLVSMTENSHPSRAEVSDVATAVVIGSDCVMLSEETAVGNHPVESVIYMKRIVKYAESNSPVDAVYREKPDKNSKQSAICESVVHLANQVDATAIVAETKSGATAIQLASRRPKLPIIAATSSELVANQLSIVYGIKSYVRPDDKYAARKLTDWLVKNKVLLKGDTIVTASGQYPGVIGTTDTIKVRVL